MFERSDAGERFERFVRLPGLFRRWELSEVLDFSREFVLENAGRAADGTQLLAVYKRERCRKEGT